MLKNIALVLASTLAVGCVAEADDEIVQEEARQTEIDEIVENLLAAGYTEEDIEIIEVEDSIVLDGVPLLELGSQVFVEGDVHVSLEASRELAGIDGEDAESFRHWRTPGLVNNNTTICLHRVVSWMNDGISGAPYYSLLHAPEHGNVSRNGLCDEQLQRRLQLQSELLASQRIHQHGGHRLHLDQWVHLQHHRAQ